MIFNYSPQRKNRIFQESRHRIAAHNCRPENHGSGILPTRQKKCSPALPSGCEDGADFRIRPRRRYDGKDDEYKDKHQHD